ncbi:MAG: tyrosine--tRNA ligase [Nitrospirota bacterium]|nr:tyrosine--tRNA ligase [Nitrospirota bacterium]
MGTSELDRQLDLILRGTVEVIQLDELKVKLAESLKTQRPLKIKAGFDPTAPDLHLGHTVLIQKLKNFQDLGHQVIFLIGDFTGMIGDPSGVSETRKALTKEQVVANAKTYEQQIFKTLDPEKTRIEFNSRWMSAMPTETMVEICSHYSVARMLERDDFSKRYRDQKPISIHEFLYPLVQGYDSVALEADVELGGTDQKFNLLVGRDLQRNYGQKPQVVLTMPLLEGTDGIRKMSKSFGNVIALEDRPADMFGKLMSISDDLMMRYYELLTVSPLEDVKQQHPMEAKKSLAERIVRQYHGDDGAEEAKSDFQQRFQKRDFPDEPDAHLVLQTKDFVNPKDCSLSLVDILLKTGLVPSKGEARRLISQKAIQVDGEKMDDTNGMLSFKPEQKYSMKIGKRKYALIEMIGE